MFDLVLLMLSTYSNNITVNNPGKSKVFFTDFGRNKNPEEKRKKQTVDRSPNDGVGPVEVF